MISKGKWIAPPYTRCDGNNIRWVKLVKGKRRTAICQTFSPHAESHAQFIAEAGNVADETGLMPRELLELYIDLLDYCDDGSASFDDPEPGSVIDRAKQALTKAKG